MNPLKRWKVEVFLTEIKIEVSGLDLRDKVCTEILFCHYKFLNFVFFVKNFYVKLEI